MALEGDGRRLGTVLNVPESDQVITGRGCEEVGGGRVELDLSNFPKQLASASNIVNEDSLQHLTCPLH